MNDSLSQVRFYQELAEMKTQHEVDKLELKNRQMDLEVAQAHSHLLQMGGGAAFLFNSVLSGWDIYRIAAIGMVNN